jgi:hypothetical protein
MQISREKTGVDHSTGTSGTSRNFLSRKRFLQQLSHAPVVAGRRMRRTMSPVPDDWVT